MAHARNESNRRNEKKYEINFSNAAKIDEMCFFFSFFVFSILFCKCMPIDRFGLTAGPTRQIFKLLKLLIGIDGNELIIPMRISVVSAH